MTTPTREFRQDIADAIEPYLSWQYNVSIGRTDWAEEGLKSVSVGEGHELYQAVLKLLESAEREAFEEGWNDRSDWHHPVYKHPGADDFEKAFNDYKTSKGER